MTDILVGAVSKTERTIIRHIEGRRSERVAWLLEYLLARHGKGSKVRPAEDSAEIAAERGGDIAPAIYEAYFARCPESRELMRYVDRYMRGRMLDSLFELLMADTTSDPFRYLQFEAANHKTYGVLPHMYENLLIAVRDTVRETRRTDWARSMAVVWNSRLALMLREIRSSCCGHGPLRFQRGPYGRPLLHKQSPGSLPRRYRYRSSSN